MSDKNEGGRWPTFWAVVVLCYTAAILFDTGTPSIKEAIAAYIGRQP